MNPKKNARIAIVIVGIISIICGILAIARDQPGLWVIVGAGVFTCLLIGIFITSKSNDDDN